MKIQRDLVTLVVVAILGLTSHSLSADSWMWDPSIYIIWSDDIWESDEQAAREEWEILQQDRQEACMELRQDRPAQCSTDPGSMVDDQCEWWYIEMHYWEC